MSKTTPNPLKVVSPNAVAKTGTQTVAKRAANAAGVVTAIKDVVDAASEYGQTREQERTKRTAISAAKEVAVQRITSQERLIAKAADQTFDERKHRIDRSFDLLDRALERGTEAQWNRAADLLTDAVRDNPLEQVCTLLGQQSNTESPIWDL